MTMLPPPTSATLGASIAAVTLRGPAVWKFMVPLLMPADTAPRFTALVARSFTLQLPFAFVALPLTVAALVVSEPDMLPALATRVAAEITPADWLSTPVELIVNDVPAADDPSATVTALSTTF